MTVVSATREAPRSASQHAGLRPCLIRREELVSTARSWDDRRFGASTAYLTLSPQLACVLVDSSGAALTQQQLGVMGLSIHEAWDAAAAEVLNQQCKDGLLELWVRDARTLLGAEMPRGYQLRGMGVPASTWLTHPHLFTIAHLHFRHLLKPRLGLTYATNTFRDLFVFDAEPSSFARRFDAVHVLKYSVGFPLLVSCEAAPKE